MAALAAWQNFYVILGSAAGALVGLQFVALSLINTRDAAASAAFATPTVVHFATALGLSAMMCAPWNGIGGLAAMWVIAGLGGLLYHGIVTRRMRGTSYKPEFEDWLFHSLLPIAAHTALLVSAYVAQSQLREALFVVAASVLMLLVAGIHNTWDAVTYHLFHRD